MATIDNDDGKEIIQSQLTRESRVYLYDPPRGGKTPVDGAGELCKSLIRLADVEAKVALGFTREPVGQVEEPEAPVEKPAKKPARKRAAK